MASYNKVILLGNLTRDPELRTTPGGLTIAKFGLAVSRRYKSQDGEQKEEVTFVDISAFGKQAEVIDRYFNKGSAIFVEGRLKFDQWESNNGEKRNKLSVVMENFQFVGSKGDNENGGSYQQSSPPVRESQPAAASTSASADSFDDDIPF